VSTGAGGGSSTFHCKAGDPPIALASGLHWPYSIAADGDFVYFATYDKDAGGVWRVPKQGGAVEPLASALDFADQLVIVGGFIYATVAGENRVIRVPEGGGSVTTFASNQDGVSGLATDCSALYWTNYLGNSVVVSDLAGNTKTFPAAEAPFRISASPDRIFYSAAGGGLQWIMKDGSATGSIPSMAPRTPLVGADGRIYWTDHGLWRANTDGTGIEAFGSLPPENGQFADGLAMDADNVFVALTFGEIVRFSLHEDAGGPVALFTGQDAPSGVAVDDTCVFWTNTSPGTAAGNVMRGPK